MRPSVPRLLLSSPLSCSGSSSSPGVPELLQLFLFPGVPPMCLLDDLMLSYISPWLWALFSLCLSVLQSGRFLLVYLHVCASFILQSQIHSSAHPGAVCNFSCSFLKRLCGVLHGAHVSAEFLHVSNHHKHNFAFSVLVCICDGCFKVRACPPPVCVH